MFENKYNELYQENEELKLISDKYENLTSLLEFECPEGHKVVSTWKQMRNKLSCPLCDKMVYKKTENIQVQPKKQGVRRIIALDQSSRITGFSIFDDDELIKFGIIETTAQAPIE